jgi:hypothetical protein
MLRWQTGLLRLGAHARAMAAARASERRGRVLAGRLQHPTAALP